MFIYPPTKHWEIKKYLPLYGWQVSTVYTRDAQLRLSWFGRIRREKFVYLFGSKMYVFLALSRYLTTGIKDTFRVIVYLRKRRKYFYIGLPRSTAVKASEVRRGKSYCLFFAYLKWKCLKLLPNYRRMALSDKGVYLFIPPVFKHF